MSRIEEVDCKRCGKKVSSLKAPIFTTSEMYAKYRAICKECWTENDSAQYEYDANEALRDVAHDVWRKLNL